MYYFVQVKTREKGKYKMQYVDNKKLAALRKRLVNGKIVDLIIVGEQTQII